VSAGLMFRPGNVELFYNSLLNLKFTGSTKIIAFADDLLLLIRSESERNRKHSKPGVDKNL